MKPFTAKNVSDAQRTGEGGKLFVNRSALPLMDDFRPSPGCLRKTRKSKSLLVLFFRKEQNLLFLKKKKQKDFILRRRFKRWIQYETFLRGRELVWGFLLYRAPGW